MIKSKLPKTFALSAVVGLSAILTSCDTYDRDDSVVTTTSYRTGDTVTVLPKRYRTVDVDGSSYYYSGGTYYQPRGSSYVVVNRPVMAATTKYTYGTPVTTLPSRYNTVRYRNKNYYHSDGRYYRPRGSSYVTVRDPFHY